MTIVDRKWPCEVTLDLQTVAYDHRLACSHRAGYDLAHTSSTTSYIWLIMPQWTWQSLPGDWVIAAGLAGVVSKAAGNEKVVFPGSKSTITLCLCCVCIVCTAYVNMTWNYQTFRGPHPLPCLLHSSFFWRAKRNCNWTSYYLLLCSFKQWV